MGLKKETDESIVLHIRNDCIYYCGQDGGSTDLAETVCKGT